MSANIFFDQEKIPDHQYSKYVFFSSSSSSSFLSAVKIEKFHWKKVDIS